MELHVSGHTLKLYNQINIGLKYDSVSGKFDGAFYFNPDSGIDKKLYKPGTYQTCTITHGGVKVLTGTILAMHFSSAGDPPKQLCYISGYSITGILENSSIGMFQDYKVDKDASNQFDGLTLQQITETVCKIYPLKVKVDAELLKDIRFTAPYAHHILKQDQTIADYLNLVCTQKQVVLSHTADGQVLLTRANVNKVLTTSATLVRIESTPFTSDVEGAPPGTGRIESSKSVDRKVLFHFVDGDAKWFKMDLVFDGSQLSSIIQVVGEANSDNAAESVVVNPYVNDQSTFVPGPSSAVFKAGLRFRREIQTAGDENDTPLIARAILGDELKRAIVLTIRMQGWTLGGNLVTPNQIITVKSPENYIFKATKFFIQEVHLYADEVEENAVLTCVLPECFNDDDIVNIFN